MGGGGKTPDEERLPQIRRCWSCRAIGVAGQPIRHIAGCQAVRSARTAAHAVRHEEPRRPVADDSDDLLVGTIAGILATSDSSDSPSVDTSSFDSGSSSSDSSGGSDFGGFDGGSSGGGGADF